MIGYVFPTSGATCLALAPSSTRPDEYLLIVKTETGYGVANILAEALGREGGPTSWMRGSYYDHGTREDNLRSAVAAFAAETGLNDIEHLVAVVEHAEQVVEHRQYLIAATS